MDTHKGRDPFLEVPCRGNQRLCWNIACHNQGWKACHTPCRTKPVGFTFSIRPCRTEMGGPSIGCRVDARVDRVSDSCFVFIAVSANKRGMCIGLTGPYF